MAESDIPESSKGWHSRGYIPHFDSNHIIQHVTIRLADSLPQQALDRLASELEETDPAERDLERRRRLELLVDAGHGACWLRRPDCAQIVQNALLHFDGVRHRMLAWVVMPNHVHVLFQTMDGWSMAKVVSSWKVWTGREIAAIVFTDRQSRYREVSPSRTRAMVWYPEYWDRFIRDERHLANAIAYIHNNPVKAGLVGRAEDWPWSSASLPRE